MILVQHDSLNMSPLGINIQDIAVLRCVSRNVLNVVNTYIKDDNQAVFRNTLCFLNIPCDKLDIHSTSHIIKLGLLVRHLLVFRRLYNDIAKKTKLISTIDSFTKHDVNQLWKKQLNKASKDEQKQTIHLLLYCAQGDNESNLQQNIIIIYVIMCFISKSYNSMGHQSLFAHEPIKKIIITKCEELSINLREEITSYPYMFIDRVIRKIGDVRRMVLNTM